LTVLIAIFAVGCGEKVVDSSKLVKRGGLYYEVNSEKSFTGKVIGLHENGKAEAEYRDGKLNGKVTTWYENGQKRSEGEWRDGKERGKWTYWYENGQKERESEYRDGKEISEKRYYWDGKPK